MILLFLLARNGNFGVITLPGQRQVCDDMSDVNEIHEDDAKKNLTKIRALEREVHLEQAVRRAYRNLVQNFCVGCMFFCLYIPLDLI